MRVFNAQDLPISKEIPMIKINLKIEPRGEYREMEVAPGTTIEALYKQVQDERSGKGKGVTSVSNDGYSESYASEAQTREALTDEMRGCIRQWLSGTGMVGAY